MNKKQKGGILKYIWYNILYMFMSLSILWMVLVFGMAIEPFLFTKEKQDYLDTIEYGDRVYLVKLPFTPSALHLKIWIAENIHYSPRIIMGLFILYLFTIEPIYEKMISYRKHFAKARSEFFKNIKRNN